jgi:hypothetical protein
MRVFMHGRRDWTAQQKTRVVSKVSDTKSAPIPETLVTQMQKPRGAKFFVDQNGAIIIIGEGSNQVDAVIEPQNRE